MGSFEAVDTGSPAKRVVLGFGSGAADLRTAVEGHLMTAQGLRRLGAGTLEAREAERRGSRSPWGSPSRPATRSA
jgi:hypothetical protein